MPIEPAPRIHEEPPEPSEVFGGQSSVRRTRLRPAYVVQPAAHPDESYSDDRRVPALRLVYRVRLFIPYMLGNAPSAVPDPMAELHFDVSDERLRARFEGSGWPVETDAEVRVRSDINGSYVFDSAGGHPHQAGRLMDWFQGGEVGEDHEPSVMVLPPRGHADGQGRMVCAFLAEWSGESRRDLMRRCGTQGAPFRFRVGPWIGERTAEFPVMLPATSLRADHENPPRVIPYEPSRKYVSRVALELLRPSAPREEPPGEDDPAEGIVVRNEMHYRLIVTIGGAAAGWVNPGEEFHAEGVRPGVHLVAGLRPLGTLGYRPREVAAPANVRVR